jgi:hypothetical protein
VQYAPEYTVSQVFVASLYSDVHIWDIIQCSMVKVKQCFREHIASIKNAVFWDVMPYGSCKNRCFSARSVLTRATQGNIPENDILQSHGRENLESYTALTGWSLLRRRNVFPVRYELGFYTPQNDVLHSHRRENFKSYI